MVLKRDEYDFDSSDEEDIRNTVGNIPMQWYSSYPHVGYDANGRPIMRPTINQMSSDAISNFLKTASTEDGEQDSEWRTITDPSTGQSVLLSDRDLEIVTRMSAGKGVFGDMEDNIYKPWDDIFSSDVLQMPVTAQPPHKRSFIPSLLDRRRVGRITHAMKMGWIRPHIPSWALDDINDADKVRRFAMYQTSGRPGAFDDDDDGEILGFSASNISLCTFPDVWADVDSDTNEVHKSFAWQAGLPLSLQTYRPPRPRPYMRPAAEPLPSHAESYNPPPEFLLSPEEERQVMRAWRDKVNDNQATKVLPLMPRKFDCLRHVPFSEKYLREREERIKDMIMAARVEKQKVHSTPEALLPEIPSLSDLRPYPSHLGVEYKSHNGRVTDLSVSPCGQWLASVSPADGCLRIWETLTNFCFRCYQLAPPVAGRSRAVGLSDSSGFLEEKTEGVGREEDYDEIKLTSAYVAWNPNPDLCLVAVAIGQTIFVINPGLGDIVIVEKTDKMLREYWRSHLLDSEEAQGVDLDTEVNGDNEDRAGEEEDDSSTSPALKRRKLSAMRPELPEWRIKLAGLQSTTSSFSVEWNRREQCKTPMPSTFLSRSRAFELSRITIQLNRPCIDLSWHPKGDYLMSLTASVLSSEARSRAANRLLLHRLSRMSSQAPFAAVTSSVEEWRTAAFHPAGKPVLMVAGPRNIYTYDLAAQKELGRLKLDLSSDQIRCTCVHPTGDHIVVGTSDSRFVWFDIELGNIPFKKLRLNHGTIHKVCIHNRRPLVSVALDDGSLFILHAKVTDDLLSKPIVIPVQLIRTGFKNTFSSVFHNRLPHVYAGGNDGTIRQFVAWN